MMKRIILCTDGTWQVSHNAHPSNVAIIARSIPAYDSKGIAQLVYYQKGVGTNPCKVQQLVGAGTGEGINDNIGCAYIYLCHNWCPGDEIYMFGYSRGAYTARAVAGLVCEFGLLSKPGIEGFGKVYERYINDSLDADAIKMLAAKYGRTPDVPIKFIGVWDTVGSLGVPEFWIAGWKPILINYMLRKARTFQLHKVELYPNIEVACHGLALDERRAPFSPTLWHLSPDNDKTILKQVWFPGIHSSVGGGEPDHGISSVAIAWMVQQLNDHTDLQLDLDYLGRMRSRGEDSMGKPWGCGRFEDTYRGIFKISGAIRRTPGKYSKGAISSITNEYVHKSVILRMKNPDAKYTPPDVSELEEAELGELEKTLSW